MLKHVLYPLMALAALATGGLATVVVALDLAGLVERADVIAAGRCVRVEAARDARGLVTTTVELLVLDGLRGPGRDEIFRFTLPGGEVDDRGLLVPGMPRFRPGDEAFLFLTAPTADGLRVPVGLGQGTFRIERDPDTGERCLRRSLEGLDLVSPDSGAPVEPPSAASPRNYDAFRAAVQRLLDEGR